MAARNYKTRIAVVAAYENGVTCCDRSGACCEWTRLRGFSPVVTRRLEGPDLIWSYPSFTARLRRIGEPDATPAGID